ncbi:response regulator [Paenibacillus bovis]|uniref:Circadian input-output histidine kinase CikA n=1 Tax=Paenibacillus bovis TaxID=1616788 RepID=A0A172ZL43_9BACL|nr:response regulator [Paenibacillus bovis]ANF98259.1 histidine kinase [Paenibacillus bovis]
MKLRTKLVLGFSVIILLLMTLGFITYDRMNYMNEQLDKVYQERYLKVRYSTDVRSEMNVVAREVANMLLSASAQPIEKSRATIEQNISSGENNLKLLSSSANSPEEKKQIETVISNWQIFVDYSRQLTSLVAGDQIAAANNYRTQVGLDAQTNLNQSISDLAEYQDNAIDKEIAEANAAYQNSIRITTYVMLAGVVLSLLVMLWIVPSISKGLGTVSLMIKGFSEERFGVIRRIKVKSKDEIGDVARVFQQMAEDLQEKRHMEEQYRQAQEDQSWLDSNTARITELLRGVNTLEQSAQTFINEFAPTLGAHFGAIYLRTNEASDKIMLKAAYAADGELCSKKEIRIGEGLTGQCAADQKPIVLDQVPEGYIPVNSGLGSGKPQSVLIYPIMFNDELLGVIELASLRNFASLQRQLLHLLTQDLGIIINNINRRLHVEELLRESQALTEELQSQSEELQLQQEELRRSNERLEEQTEELKRSEDMLQRQQEELEHFNNELIAKTRELQEQIQHVEEQNEEIEQSKHQLEQQAMQLAVTSKYKSEFLANMSHELRTPLNSLLILSQLLTENKDGNLTDKQMEYASTIYMSGADLLKMIDEILDLSKVDAGKMEINREAVPVTNLESFVNMNFAPVAAKKGIDLLINIGEQMPEAIVTDEHRVKQVLRNMLSNAFKFTEKGYIEMNIDQADPGELPSYLNREQAFIAIKVIDSGIGIPQDKLDLIFEAFQQVDGTTSRKYGGTGLGLSISRELARLLGGGITVGSEEGKGSTFTLYLPKLVPSASDGAETNTTTKTGMGVEQISPAYMSADFTDQVLQRSSARATNRKPVTESESAVIPQPLADDRDQISKDDKVLLIIEDDPNFAKILMDMARDRGFKALVGMQGDTGLHMAKTYKPDAIILDIQLPVIDGWAILSELKSNAHTRHIPVHVISVMDDVKQGLMMGAIAYLKKPSSKEALEKAFSHLESYTEQGLKQLLIVEDDEIQRQSIIELIGHDDVSITAVSTGKAALEELDSKRYDCMVLDLMLTDMTGFELLDRIRDNHQLKDLPIIIYTGKDLDTKEETQLRKYAESIIVKDVKSPERLLDETTLFLHRVEADLPEDKRRILQKLHNKETLFEGKRILLVDDDVRNVFALSSVLEGYRMEVTFAENGREAIDILNQQEFDLILMDMMMPEMDGYEAMRIIRQMPEYDKLPIIALTAKAMKDDRSKCIEAGASDYVKKPIQTDQLLSLMRVWLYS